MIHAAGNPLKLVGSEISRGVRDLGSRFGMASAGLLVMIVAIAVVPAIVADTLQISSLAAGLYIVLAAIGLNFAIGLAGIPSLGQGGFVGIGAFLAAWLAARWGWNLVSVTAAGTGAAAVAGFVVGAGAARLTRVYAAITTWVCAWMLEFVLADFPRVSGGSQGLPLPPARLEVLGNATRFTPVWHYETALVLVMLTLCLYSAVKRSPAGLHLTALRQRESGALILGAHRTRLRTAAVVASAAIGGLAGALLVQVYGIADPTSYGPLLSVKLFVAVIVGGSAFAIGPVVGAIALVLVGPTAHALGNLADLSPERFEPVVAAVLLLMAVAAGGQGVLPRLKKLVRSGANGSSPVRHSRPITTAASNGPPGRTIVEAREITKTFGGVRALEMVDLEVRAGTVHAVIGPNGSGKSTLLKIASGSLHADSGVVRVDGDLLGPSVAAARSQGIVRTLQRTVIFEGMSVREHVVAGGLSARPMSGTLRHVARTPSARADEESALADADRILEDVGIGGAGDVPAERLSGAEQRYLMIAMALAAHPRVMLLDEPGAGMSPFHVAGLVDLILSLSSTGMAIVLVDHNLRLVRATASEVTVLSSGRVIASGPTEETIHANEVRRLYTGFPSQR